MLRPLGRDADAGVYVKIGGRHRLSVYAPIAPGVVANVGVEDVRLVRLGERIPLEAAPMMALDGERELEFNGETLEATVTRDGPKIVDLDRLMLFLAEEGFFTRPAGRK